MTGKKSSIILGIIVLGIVLLFIFSKLAHSPLPISEIPSLATCEEQGLITDPADTTKCLAPVATSTSTTTPPAPVPLPTPKPTLVTPFNTLVTFATKQTQTFTDGLKITLTTINDSRCPADVTCIWEGELSADLSVTGGAFGTSVETVSLGTVRARSTTRTTYTFTLKQASETEVTLSVVKNTPAKQTVTITGSVSIGPICPVERIDVPCITPPEAYTSRNIIVYGPAESNKISETPLRSDGTYTLSLAPGNYWLQIDPAGIGPGEKKPVTLKANDSLTVDFDIDTGIR